MTQAPARVVGTPRWNMASLHRNSRMLERSTLRPSACLKSEDGHCEALAGNHSAPGLRGNGGTERKHAKGGLKTIHGQLTSLRKIEPHAVLGLEPQGEGLA